jgi:hypothetical protein
MIRRLTTRAADFTATLDALLTVDEATDAAIENAVAEIIARRGLYAA